MNRDFICKMWIMAIVVILLPAIAYASINEKITIKLNSEKWEPNSISNRSFFLPFTAYYDESILTIRNEKPACDLTIILTDVQTGSPVYTMEVSQENSAFITIPLDGLGRGEYCLTISHPEAGYVYGTFNL